jgi:hypothetical protein
MRKKVEIEIDVDLIDEAIRRFQYADAREEYDEFSDLSAWQPRPSGDASP